MKCPECTVELTTSQKLGQGVFACSQCGYKWFILKITQPKWKKGDGLHDYHGQRDT